VRDGLFRCWLAALVASSGRRAPSPEGLELFREKVSRSSLRPAYKCHSHDADKIKGGLLLDSQEGALERGRTPGPALVRRKTRGESPELKRSATPTPSPRMPPKGKKLSG